MALQYRPDIDGLRAVAVLAVLLYHLGVPGFEGGYVGVDVFFVISGFLITRLIRDECLASGTFSFSNFYTRRLRRLFPAMVATGIATVIAGGLLFSPTDFSHHLGSLIFYLTGVSNVHFWLESGYFDAEALTKPLLHSWSLGVEEQFYLIWPLALSFMLLRRQASYAPIALIVAILLSLVAGEIMLEFNRAAAFFLLPARIAELGIGALLVWVAGWRPSNPLVEEGMLLAGLAMIAAAILIYEPETRFPGLAALLPCAGAALAIQAGQARHAGLLLRNPLGVLIGKASYSIYLVHWPIIVFVTAYTFAELTPGHQGWIFAAALALGYLQFRFVEQPFRRPKTGVSRRRFVIASVAAALALIVPAAAVWATGGAEWRVPQDRIMASIGAVRDQQDDAYCGGANPGLPDDLFTCKNFRNKDRDIILFGDSHAKHLVSGMSENFPAYNIYVIYQSACVAQSGIQGYVRKFDTDRQTEQCIERNARAIEFLSTYRPSTVIVSNAKRGDPEIVGRATNEILSRLRAAGHNAFMLGDFIRPGIHLESCFSVPDVLLSNYMLAKRCAGKRDIGRQEIAYNRETAAIVDGFIDPTPIQCPNDRCRFVEDGMPLFRDHHHLSLDGAIRLVGEMKPFMPIR